MKFSSTVLAKLAILIFAFASGPGRSVAADLYVATNGTGDGSSWPNAMGSIQDGIDAISGIYPTNTVWVSNGVYEVGGVTNFPTGRVLTNRVAIYKAITVRSANNDPTNTVIKGAWASDGNTSGVDAVRCVYMTNGSTLIGFMVTNGATLTYVASETDDHRGGGLWCQSTNTVISNCVITGNAASRQGGGTYKGTLYNCALTYNSTMIDPYPAGGGGARLATLYYCSLTGNKADQYGGGANDCTLYYCTLISNRLVRIGAGGGGGIYLCTMYNCALIGNSGHSGGAINSGTAYNCLVANNSAVGSTGGGARYSNMYNCTIVSNSSAGSGGGVYNSYLYNCISWGNNKNDYNPTSYYSCGVGDLYTNNNSTTNNPLFVNFDTGDYHLNNNSPCVNTGTNFSWMTDPADVRSKDLDGRSRIDKFSSRPDMGCYEYLPSGTMLKVR